MQHQLPLDQQTENIRRSMYQIQGRLADFSSDMRDIQRTLDFHDRVLRSCCPNEMPRFQGSGVHYQGSGVHYQGSGVHYQGGGGLFKSMFKRKKSKRKHKKSKRRRRRSRTRRRSR